MVERLITDVGGMPAGDVPREDVPYLFWQKHMMAMFSALWNKGVFNLDEFRRTVEQMSPDDYKNSSFYPAMYRGCPIAGRVDVPVQLP